MKPQAAHVLRRLREAGPAGVHSHALRNDPQGYVADPAKRVCELRELGFEIESRRETLAGSAIGARYVLRSQNHASRMASESPGVASPKVDRVSPDTLEGGPDGGGPAASRSAPVIGPGRVEALRRMRESEPTHCEVWDFRGPELVVTREPLSPERRKALEEAA